MRFITILVFLLAASRLAHCQALAFHVDLSADNTLEFTNISGNDISLLDFEIVSPEEFLIPIPPGDLRGDPDPFTFLLSNNPRQVTFGSLAKIYTIPAGETWSTLVGYDLAGAREAGDVLQASWGFDPIGGTICGLTAGACPEPATGALAMLGALSWFVCLRRRGTAARGEAVTRG